MSQSEVKAFLVNLQLLGYKPTSPNFFTDLKFFEMSHKSQFEEIVQFLFHILDADKADTVFKHCTPCVNHQRSQEFRRVCVDWWKIIAQQHPSLNLPKVSGMMLKDLRGPVIAQLMHRFSVFVLKTETDRLSEEPSLHFMTPCTGVLAEIQKSTTAAASNAEFKEFVQLMQIVQKEEQNLRLFVDRHVKSYRESNKKNEELTLLRNKLQRKQLSRAMTPSKRGNSVQSFNETDYNIARKKLNSALMANRRMNANISQTLRDMQHGQAVVNLIKKENENGKITLSAAKVNACVPALLVQKHTAKVYEKIGRSLYTAGKLNLQSMIGLFNLSLNLLNEKVHEVGLPGFEAHLQSVHAQNHIQAKNHQTLVDIHENLTMQVPVLQLKISQLKHSMNTKMLHQKSTGVAISPQKYPWVNYKNNSHTPVVKQTNKMPMVSYGMKTFHSYMPSPLKQVSPVTPKKMVNVVQSSLVPTYTPKSKTVKSKKKKNRVHIKPTTLPLNEDKIAAVQESMVENTAKEKHASDRALSELASNIVNGVVLETPTPKPVDENVFNLSDQITDKAFRSAPLLSNTPPNGNDSVFIRETTPIKNLKSEVLLASKTEYIDHESTTSQNKENEFLRNDNSFSQNVTDMTLVNDSGRLLPPSTEYNTPLSTISINSRFLRTQSQITTDESEVEKTPFHVWKKDGEVLPMDSSFDLLNFQIPDMNQSVELLDLIKTPASKQEVQKTVPTANLLDLSIQEFPDNNANELPKTDNPIEMEDICLIDFS